MDGDPPDAVASLSTTLSRLDVAHDEPLLPSTKAVAPKSPGRLSDAARGSSFPTGPIRRASGIIPRKSTTESRASIATTVSSKSDDEIASAPVTAASVASTLFTKELALHDESEVKTDTIVILHDSTFGHRWSRPKTSKSTLGLIVERPERIKAAIRGISTAYVRLGERYSGGANAPHPRREVCRDIPFRIKRTSRLLPLTSQAPVNIHGSKWMKELQVMCESAEAKLAAGQKEVGRSEEPGQPTKTKLHEGDLYLCRDSLDALQGALGGVVDGVDAVFTRHKKAFVCIRPPGHHCSADLPSGFCWINNVHVGIEHAALSHGLTHAAIIDFDLHHGDGSQAITWARNTKTSKATKRSLPTDRTSIGYFSLHDINSYPCEYGDVEKVQNASLCIENAHAQTIWNVHLQPWASEDEFWKHYGQRYIVLLDKARQYLHNQTERIKLTQPGVEPKAVIFISAGFDASEWESEGMQRHKVNVPTSFYTRFTEDIVKIAGETSTSAEGRVVSVLEGGYSDRALTSGIMSHLVGLTSSTSHSSGTREEFLANKRAIDQSDWWSSKSLKELESALLPPSTATAKESSRSAEPQAFWSPTRSFSAKVVDPSKLYRSISGATAPTRSPSPPAPEVEWPVAAHEMCKLLVPSDRQVDSCKYEELAEVKVKRERTSSIMPPPQVPGDRMQLRGRRSGVGFHASPATTTPLPQKGAASEPSTRLSTPGIPAATAAKVATAKLPPSSDQPSVTVRKSRRISGAVDLLGRERISNSVLTATLPSQPVPVPVGAPNVDSLVAGVKKITLRYNGPKDTEAPAVKPAKKASIPKPAKSNSPVKTAAIKSASSNSLPHAIRSNTAIPLSDGRSSNILQVVPPISKLEKPTDEDSTTGRNTSGTYQPAASPLSNGVSAEKDTATQLTSIAVNPSKESTQIAVPAFISAIFSSSKVPSPPSSAPNISQTSSTPPAQIPSSTPSQLAGPNPAPESNPPQPSPSQAPSESNQFIPYVPENGAHDNHPNTLASKANGLSNLTWLVPNTSTPAASPAPPKRGNQEATRLPPVFTSDGHIPFAEAGRR